MQVSVHVYQRKRYNKIIFIAVNIHMAVAYQPVTLNDILQPNAGTIFHSLFLLQVIAYYNGVIAIGMHIYYQWFTAAYHVVLDSVFYEHLQAGRYYQFAMLVFGNIYFYLQALGKPFFQ